MKSNEEKYNKIIETVSEEITELYEFYKKDKNLFNKIINLFNCHLKNNLIVSLEDDLRKDIKSLLGKDYLSTIVAYTGIPKEKIELELEKSFEYELNYCSICISNLILQSYAAKKDPLDIFSIEESSFDGNYVILKLTRNDNNSIIFKADCKDLKAIKSVIERTIKKIDSENKNSEYKD